MANTAPAPSDRPCEDMCVVPMTGRDLLLKREDALALINLLASKATPLASDWGDRNTRWALVKQDEPPSYSIVVLSPSHCAAIYMKDPK